MQETPEMPPSVLPPSSKNGVGHGPDAASPAAETERAATNRVGEGLIPTTVAVAARESAQDRTIMVPETDEEAGRPLPALRRGEPGRGIMLWRLLALTSDGHLVPAPLPFDPLTASADPYANGAVTPHWEATPDEFFHLYAQVERQAGERRVIGVTSALTGEGKTTVALHLALSAARSSHRRVCLVDFSLGEDDLCRRIGAAPAPGGVIPLLEGDGPLAVLERPGGEAADRLTVFPASRSPRNAARAARSPLAATLIDALRDEYDLVIIDLPAAVTDNLIPLASLMDGVLLVTRAGATPRSVVQSALDVVGRDQVIGVVLNRVATTAPWKKGQKR